MSEYQIDFLHDWYPFFSKDFIRDRIELEWVIHIHYFKKRANSVYYGVSIDARQKLLYLLKRLERKGMWEINCSRGYEYGCFTSKFVKYFNKNILRIIPVESFVKSKTCKIEVIKPFLCGNCGSNSVTSVGYGISVGFYCRDCIHYTTKDKKVRRVKRITGFASFSKEVFMPQDLALDKEIKPDSFNIE